MKLALAGDAMLGGKVAERLAGAPPTVLLAEEVVDAPDEVTHGECGRPRGFETDQVLYSDCLGTSTMESRHMSQNGRRSEATTMTMTSMRTRAVDVGALRSDVEEGLDWDRAVSTTSIGVSVTDHAVALSGMVHTLAHRIAVVVCLLETLSFVSAGVNAAVRDGSVVLTGTGHTRSFAARTRAESVAWLSPGVELVHDTITISA